MATATVPPSKGNNKEKSLAQSMLCYHCHDEILKALKIQIEDKNFCCEGCKMVYEILNENNLCTYYDLDANAGLSQKGRKDTRAFDFLNDPSVGERLVDFQDETTTKVTFLIPAMHCASCIWLLEYLYKITSGDQNLIPIFGYLNLILATPVLLYSVIIKNQEIIPADGILLRGSANID